MMSVGTRGPFRDRDGVRFGIDVPSARHLLSNMDERRHKLRHKQESGSHRRMSRTSVGFAIVIVAILVAAVLLFAL